MIEDIKELEKLDMTIQKELVVDMILQSLTILYGQFMVNYHMNNHYSILSKFVNILVTKESWKVQKYIPEEPKEVRTRLRRHVEIVQNWSYDFLFSQLSIRL